MQPMSDLESFAQSRVGTTLRAKYRLDKLLGVGGMAAVYQATHRVGNHVALKVLHPHMSINADVRARFLREGYVANRVEHPGAVRVLDDDMADDGSVFLAMELLKGETLETLWERRGQKLPVREVAELAHQLLDVLAAAHDKGIIHRDIKPENLFLTDEGVLKVLDFGIARLADATAPGGATQTGRMLGSPAFMPPEQALGLQRKIDGQTDLWSAGATMFTLLSGHYVHDAETVEMLLVRAGSEPARSLATVAPELPPPIVAVVDGALAFDKRQRWASARAMQEVLEDAYARVFGASIPGVRTSRLSAQLAPVHDEVRASAAQRVSALRATVDNTEYGVPPTLYEVPPQAVMSTQSMPLGASTTAGIEPSAREPNPRPGAAGRRLLVGLSFAGAAGVIATVAVLSSVGDFGPRQQASASGAALIESVVDVPPALPGPGPEGGAVALATLPSPDAESSTRAINHPLAPKRVLEQQRSAPVVPGSEPSHKDDCDPPYTIDPAQPDVKHWKMECFKQ